MAGGARSGGCSLWGVSRCSERSGADRDQPARIRQSEPDRRGLSILRRARWSAQLRDCQSRRTALGDFSPAMPRHGHARAARYARLACGAGDRAWMYLGNVRSRLCALSWTGLAAAGGLIDAKSTRSEHGLELAPEEGFEPPTRRLTAACSTTELLRINKASARYDRARRGLLAEPIRARKGAHEPTDWRRGPESNRHSRICSPLHRHSATTPHRERRCYTHGTRRGSSGRDPTPFDAIAGGCL